MCKNEIKGKLRNYFVRCFTACLYNGLDGDKTIRKLFNSVTVYISIDVYWLYGSICCVYTPIKGARYVVFIYAI